MYFTLRFLSFSLHELAHGGLPVYLGNKLKFYSLKVYIVDILLVYLVHRTLGGGLPTAEQVNATLPIPSSTTVFETRVISTRGLSK